MTPAVAQDTEIHLGYEMGSGDPVRIPLRHMAVTGQTQEAGKTTTLEALISRGAECTIAARLGKGMGGWLAQHLKPLSDERYILMDGKRGVKGNLRGKIEQDLAFYAASEEDVEAVYQHCLAALSQGES